MAILFYPVFHVQSPKAQTERGIDRLAVPAGNKGVLLKCRNMKCKQEMGVDPKWRKVLNYKSGRFPPAVINEVVTVGSNPQLCQPYEDIMSTGVYSDAPQQVPAPRTRDIRQGIDEKLWHRLTPYYLNCQPVEHFA